MGREGTREGGGIQVIYYARTRQGQIWMLTLYAKNVAEMIPAHALVATCRRVHHRLTHFLVLRPASRPNSMYTVGLVVHKAPR